MSGVGDDWYRREPRRFLDGVQGMGPELIGAYTVIIDILYARGGDMHRDDRHLAGVLGCSKRKAKSLTEALVDVDKIAIEGGKITQKRVSAELEKRRKERETSAKRSRNGAEIAPTLNEINGLVLQKRREENSTPLSPQGGRGRSAGVPLGVLKILEGGK